MEIRKLTPTSVTFTLRDENDHQLYIRTPIAWALRSTLKTYKERPIDQQNHQTYLSLPPITSNFHRNQPAESAKGKEPMVEGRIEGGADSERAYKKDSPEKKEREEVDERNGEARGPEVMKLNFLLS